MEAEQKTTEHKIVRALVFVFVVGALAFAASQLDYVAISDNIAGIGYEAPEALGTIIDDLDLTGDGERILRATRPELQNKQDFNGSCTGNNANSSFVIGCFSPSKDRIYFYDIQNDELDGIKQSVLAHELLHAIWARLGNDKKEALRADLEKAYDENESVREVMQAYDDHKETNELHSVVGQVVHPDKLPESLRKHYAKYFTDHDKVVSYHDKYNEPLKKVEQRMNELKAEILTRQNVLKSMQDAYLTVSGQLDKDVKEFNACAETPNCFTSEAQFDNTRQGLLAREQQLSVKAAEIQTYLDELNGLIEEYNNHAIHNLELQESMKTN